MKRLWMVLGFILMVLGPQISRATLILAGPTATFTPTNTLASYSVTLGFALNNPLGAGTVVSLQYQTAAGTPIGAPINATVGAGGVLSVPPPPIPAAASALGNKVVITDTVFGKTKPLVWYNGAWFWGTTPKIKIDPIGLPGTSTQHWFIQDTGGAPLVGTDAVFGTRSLDIADSGFDLGYTPIGGSLYDVFISGANSFIKLSDGTYVSFYDGMPFGTINVGAGANSGSFDFSAIGLAGTWQYDASSNYTGADATSFSTFTAPAISRVPEPSTISLLLGGTAAFLTERRRRYKRNSTGRVNDR